MALCTNCSKKHSWPGMRNATFACVLFCSLVVAGLFLDSLRFTFRMDVRWRVGSNYFRKVGKLSRDIQACQSFNKILFEGNGQGRMNLIYLISIFFRIYIDQVVISNTCCFNLYLGKCSNLTNILYQLAWKHRKMEMYRFCCPPFL